ncbi:MAG TPA: acyl-CoA dehydrogenase family protein [Candidatus Binataceae bacterium]|nr:acyl-CoA dehydrogenase family protein [Candidatus Binataceae bacterium]
MDFNYTPEQREFRSQLRCWMETTAAEVFEVNGTRSEASTESRFFGRDDADWSRALEYHRRLNRAGYLALHWPREWGGAGAGLVEQAIYQDEALRMGLPLYGANQFAIDRIGPTLILLGTEAHKKRFLAPMLTGEEIWCQGYSEPNAGSDLANIQTRAVLDGDGFLVNGQKVWTSLAHRAHWQVLLVRTDAHAPRHDGISYLLVDLKSPGIAVRPLREMTGASKFNEVFYDNVRVPKENLVGQLNDGWRVSIATLMYQRLSAGARHPIERTIQELIELARKVDFLGVPAISHPYVRQTLARLYSEGQCLKLSRYRALTSHLRGKAPGAESSFGKLAASDLNLRVVMFANELLGAMALSEDQASSSAAVWMERLLGARELTIAGGSNEIQHNIIAERVLGLPKS